jgi:hypothetical protein
VEAWPGEPSPTGSGSGFDRICLVKSPTCEEAGPVPTRAGVSRASSGSSGRGRRGANCPGEKGHSVTLDDNHLDQITRALEGRA